MEHRSKHRVMRTVYCVLVLIIFCSVLNYLLATQELGIALLVSFLLGLVLFVAYEFVIIEHLKKKELIKNSIIQIYLGIVAFVSGVVALLCNIMLEISLETSFFILSALIVIILLASLRQFDSLLKKWT